MKSYKYIARDLAGARKEGFTQAASSNDVLGWLREQGFTPVSVNASASRKATKQLLENASNQQAWQHFAGSWPQCSKEEFLLPRL
ncbi:MAG: hypothetical protein AMJ43_00585 [Coxiella sp. DG_40]|nr:MAG: hypothetical protein AMJ43_00585 [Coxiella sp. DG_40]